jgi:hypothetical protein
VSSIVDFYRGLVPDYRGRWLQDIWQWDHDRLEYSHSYIQVLFPNREPSMVQPWAPVVDDLTAAAFREDPALRGALDRSLDLMLAFYGLARDEVSGAIVRAGTFAERARNWLRPYNHNHLRLTRILHSLTELALPERARALLDCLTDICRQWPDVIGGETYAYWHDAVHGGGGRRDDAALPFRFRGGLFAEGDLAAWDGDGPGGTAGPGAANDRPQGGDADADAGVDGGGAVRDAGGAGDAG